MPSEVSLRKSLYPTFAAFVGIELLRCENGESDSMLVIRDELLHGGGVVQGGVPFTMADSGMAMALQTVLEPHQDSATIEVKISYLEAVRSGSLRCEARMVRSGRRVAFLEARITEGDRLVATATGSFAILEPPQSASVNPISAQPRTGA